MTVTIVEVGPRDGLQNEPTPVPAVVKIELIRRLYGAGLRAMEVTSFVRPDRIPQLADAATVAPAVVGLPGLRSIALVPNERGLTGAIAAGVSEVAVFVAASEEFNQHNVNRSVTQSLDGFRPVADGARAAGMRVRGYVSTVLGCPYQGEVPVGDVVRLTAALFELGCHEVSLGDTIGVGAPGPVRSLIGSLAGEVDIDRLAFHGHDTYGMGVANALAAIETGIPTIDTSAGGLGGCPYAGPRAKGNLATEELVYALDRSGVETGVDLDALIATSWWLAEHLGHEPRSAVAQALKPVGASRTSADR